MPPIAMAFDQPYSLSIEPRPSYGATAFVTTSTKSLNASDRSLPEKSASLRLKIAVPELSTTTGRETVATIQQPALASNKRICKKALEEIDGLSPSNQKRLARTLLTTLQNTVLEEPLYSVATPFHPIKYVMMDDGTILLDWAYFNGRVSFFIDQDIEDSVAVFLNGLVGGAFPKTYDRFISADNVTALAAESVQFASRLA